MVELLKGPMAGIDAALQQGLHAAEIKGWFHGQGLTKHMHFTADGLAW
jgi:hypothetical protein